MIEVICNLLDQRALDSGLISECLERNITVLARLPLCAGFLSGAYRSGHRFGPGDRRARWSHDQVSRWAGATEDLGRALGEDRPLVQMAIRFLLACPGVVPIPGAKSRAQFEDLMTAARAGPLDQDGDDFGIVRRMWHERFRMLPPG